MSIIEELRNVLTEMNIRRNINNVRIAHMENVVHEIARVVYSMYIFLKMLRLQENMTVYIWQIAIIVNMHINMHLKWCMD